MSLVTEVLARRRVSRVSTPGWQVTLVEPARCLADLAVGDRAVVSDIADSCPSAFARRLTDLGLAPGAVVEFVRRVPLGDPSIYRVADYDVALRRDLARWVLVRSVA